MSCGVKVCPACGHKIGFVKFVSLLNEAVRFGAAAKVVENFSCPSCKSALRLPPNNPWHTVAKIDFFILGFVVLVGFFILYGKVGTLVLLLILAATNVISFFVSLYIYYCFFMLPYRSENQDTPR